jgi:VCBS repeat-containing protein
LVEPPETFANQALGVTSAATVSATTDQTIVVNDNDSASVAITSPGTTSVTEGGPSANVGVTLTLNTSGTGPAALAVPVSVNLPGNANYTAATATFAAGSGDGATANVAVTAVDDQFVEAFIESFPDQPLAVMDSGGADVTAGTRQTINVADNDKAQLTYSGTADLTEGDATPQVVTATLSLVTSGTGPVGLDTPVSATVTSPTNDFTAATVTWNPGDTPGAKDIGVTVIDDRLVEQHVENLIGTLLPTSAAAAEATGAALVNVTDNDSANVAITSPGTTNVTEGGSSANVGVTLSLQSVGTGPIQLAVPISATLPGNADYTATPAMFAAGAADGATANVVVAAVDDNLVEAPESFANQALGVSTTASTTASGSQTVAVTDDDTATFTINDVTVGEGAGNAAFTVNVNFGGGTANPGSDYDATTQQVTFPAGSTTSQTASVPIVDDSIHEPTETFVASLSPAIALGGRSVDTSDTGTGTIIDNDNGAPTVGDRSLTLAEDTSISATLTGTDPEHDPLTFAIVTPPSHGTVNLEATTGAIIYTPAANYNGADSFTYKANDGQVDSNIGTVSITVTPVNDPPAADDGSVNTAEDTAAVGTLTATDIDSPSLTFNIVAGPSHGTVSGFDPATGAFTYAPATNYNGADSFTFKANDGQLDSNVATESITVTPVNDPPVAIDASVSIAEDTTLTGSVTATDVDNDPLTYSLVGGAAHGTVTVSANGTFVYTPAANYDGSDSFTFKANDGQVDSNVATVSITVTAVNDPPVASDGTLTTAEDTPQSGTLSATDIDSPTLTYVVVSGPSHGTLTTFDASTGAFTYAPAANYNGADAFTFKANDGSLDSNVATVGITVTPVNDPPVANDASATTAEDTTLIGSVTAADVDGDALTYSSVGGAAHGTVTVSPNGTFIYVPAANFDGSDSFQFKANDGQADSNVATVSITVTPVNDPPVAGDGSLTTAEDTAATGTLSATDIDSPTLTFSVVSGPSHGTLTAFDASTGAFTYAPAANYNGADSFTFKANDGQADSNVATVSITVTPVNDPPVAANGTATTAEDTTLIGSLSATDVDSPTLTYSLVAGASHGTVTVNGNGTFVYTPAPNYNGPDSFTYKANDGQLDSSVAAVDITVTPVNDPPVASSGALTTAEDTAATGTLSATDIDSPTLTFSIVAGPSHGTLTAFDPATGAFTYTPSANYNGSDSFTFKANDGQADSNVATVSITVTPVNDPPVAANGTATTPEDTLLIGSVSATDVDSSNLTYSLVAGAAHGTVTVNSNGSYAYTPAANYNGPDSFTFKANDGQADSNVATVSITVTPVDDAPMAGNGTITTAEDTPVSGSVAATDVDGPTLTYSIVTQPGHGSVTLNGATGAFTYTPAANYNGPDAFTFKASDGSLDSNVATVVINVTPVNDAPVLTDDALVPPVLQATANPPGRRISSLFDGIVQDPDAGDTLSGIAVVGNPKNADQGTWQYSTDDGATWFDVGTVGDGPTALALSAAARLRFLPAPWFFGDPAPLTVRALDSTYAGGFTSGGTRVTVDTTTQGGSTAISAATRSVQDPVFPGDVPGAWLSTTGNLFVSGTAGKDTVAVSLVTRTVNKVKEKHVVVKLNGTVVGDFLQTAVSGRILVRGLGGNDKITVAAAITNGADLYGGTGNDTLTGGAGNDRLFGEDGNDRLIGGKGNDLLDGGSGNDILSDAAGTNVLIGGSGADKLTGGSGEDLFIAGSTDLDANLTDLTGLDNVMAEWTSGDTYANRVAHLQGTLTGGRNSTTVLTSATVHDDQGAKDSLIGGKGNDWFLISVPDTVTGAAAGETKTTI